MTIFLGTEIWILGILVTIFLGIIGERFLVYTDSMSPVRPLKEILKHSNKGGSMPYKSDKQRRLVWAKKREAGYVPPDKGVKEKQVHGISNPRTDTKNPRK